MAKAAALKEAAKAQKAAEKAAKAELSAKERTAKQIEQYGSVWAARMAGQQARKLEEARQAEEAATEAAKAARKEAKRKSKLIGFFEKPKAADSVELTDAEIAARREARAASKFSQPADGGEAPSVPVAEPVFDPQAAYLVTSRHLATMARPVGRNKKFFETFEESGQEAQRDMQVAKAGQMLYTEVLIWTFPNRKMGDAFTALMAQLIEDDLHAQAFFQVYELPSATGYGNGYMAGDVQFMSIAVGTAEQYKSLHATINIRDALNEGKTVQLKHQMGYKSIEGIMYCVRNVPDISDVVAQWNTEEACNIELATTPKLGVPGGWTTVAKFCKEQQSSLLVTVDRVEATDAATLASAGNWLDIMRSEYDKVAPQMSEFQVFHGWTTPIDLRAPRIAASGGGSALAGITFWNADLWARALAQAKLEIAKEMQGVSGRMIVVAGPGSASPEIRSYIGGLQATAKLSSVAAGAGVL